MTCSIDNAEAGQISAQNATGLRSRAGNVRSSRDAVRNGIFSDIVVLPGESRSKYESLSGGNRQGTATGGSSRRPPCGEARNYHLATSTSSRSGLINVSRE